VNSSQYDVVIVGSGAGGGTVAQGLVPLVEAGRRVLVLELGPRLLDHEFTGREIDMAPQLYHSGGGFFTADGTMTLAFAQVYGGSTVVYTGTSLTAPERVIRQWDVPGLTHDDLSRRSQRYLEQNGAHLLPPEEINDNNQLFVRGGRVAGYRVEQFPVNVRGCKGSSLCNLGCPNQAKQGTNRVQLPAAERGGVEIVTRAEVLRIAPDRSLTVRVHEAKAGQKGVPSEWAPGEYRVQAKLIVCAAGAVGTPALLLRSGLPLPGSLGRGFTCHPALILVAVHSHPITNDVGHPKSYFIDRAEEEGFVLETCMYFPFTTSKALVGFGEAHGAMMRAFPHQQQILVLAVDHATPESRVAVDRDGNPVVHYRFSRDALDGLVRGNRAAARIFFAAGAARVHAAFADPPTIAAGEREQLDARIDARHWKPGKQTHGLPWLRVADASLFPDALEINPYVTIMALADRVAEAIRTDSTQLLG
jgi:hypothetical protein